MAYAMGGKRFLPDFEEPGIHVGAKDNSWIAFAGRHVYASPLGSPWRNADQTACLEAVASLSELSRQPYHEGKSQIFSLLRELRGEHSRVFETLMAGSRGHMVADLVARASDEARVGLAQVGLAVELYHGERGHPPTSLNAIASEFDGTLPIDPFTGEHYQYQETEDGFLLYSVGANETDDEGTAGAHAWEGDFVWRGQPAADASPSSMESN